VNIVRSYFSTTDHEIISSLHKGGKERVKGEDLLFKRYAYFIPGAIHKYSLQQEEAFDVYTDTIIAGIEKISNNDYQGKSSLKTWLYQIFHNKCVDLLRKKTTNKNRVYQTLGISETQFQITDNVKSIIQKLIDKTDFDLLKQKLSQLGESCREMLQQWAEGLSDREIAGSMGYKNADVVKTSRLRCLDKLKQLYKSR
jgi:RNA polymerase sigma-70 factor (ECF subfamily)